MPTTISFDLGPLIVIDSVETDGAQASPTRTIRPQPFWDDVIVTMDLGSALNYGTFQGISRLAQEGSARYSTVKIRMTRKNAGAGDETLIVLTNVMVVKAQLSTSPGQLKGVLVLTTESPTGGGARPGRR